MVEVVQLKPNESPPGDDNCAIVTYDRSGRYSIEGSVVTHSRGATFYVPYPALEDDLKAAISKARSWAEGHGLKTVYVQE